MNLRLRVSPIEAARSLREQVKPVARGGSVLNSQLAHIVGAYITWAHDMETQMRQLFVDAELDELYTTRFWHIRASAPHDAQLHPMISNEANWQVERIQRIANDLEGQVERLRGDPAATLAVVDTNVFLHCHPLETFDWSFVSSGPVRIVIPIRVIEELDNRKRDPREVGDRARARIRWLHGVLADGGTNRTALKAGTTIEAFVPVGPRRLLPSADTEILEACETLEIFTERPVTIVTSDFGMELRGLHYRAASSGFIVAPVPEASRLNGV